MVGENLIPISTEYNISFLLNNLSDPPKTNLKPGRPLKIEKKFQEFSRRFLSLFQKYSTQKMYVVTIMKLLI